MSFLNNFIDNLSCRLRLWRMKKKNQTVVIRGSCKKCGKCCRNLCLYIDSSWLKRKRKFNKIKQKYDYLERFEICGKTDSGYLKFSCIYLNKNGTCDDYKNRPQLCKTFPAPTIFAQYGELPQGCGFRMSTELDFEKILEQAIEGEAQFKINSD